jgi:hypothetical protein
MSEEEQSVGIIDFARSLLSKVFGPHEYTCGEINQTLDKPIYRHAADVEKQSGGDIEPFQNKKAEEFYESLKQAKAYCDDPEHVKRPPENVINVKPVPAKTPAR